MTLTLKSPVSSVPGVGPKYSRKLNELNIYTVNDWLHYYPNRYLDYSHCSGLSRARPGLPGNFLLLVKNINSRRLGGRRIMVSATATDGQHLCRLVWFNHRHITKFIQPGEKYFFLGEPVINQYGLSLINPYSYPTDQKPLLFHPIYSEANQIKSTWLMKKISSILPLTRHIHEFLPDEYITKMKLMDYPTAMTQIHQPSNLNKLNRARYRLGFNEIFLFQIRARLANQPDCNQKAIPIKIPVSFLKSAVASLPWLLTGHQKIALWDIIQDLHKKQPMNRLLQGDVGSGKTIVAGLAAAGAARTGSQSILIAPTQVLATQHEKNLIKFFPDLSIALLTQKQTRVNQKKVTKQVLSKKINTGQINLLISTHAVWHANLKFKRLGLIIIDEQHRFGVNQRDFFNHQKFIPHTLTMSATPIPRSLALSLYGYQTQSLIKTKPSGRLPIITKITRQNNKNLVYRFIKQQLDRGHQAFVVCPLIDFSEKLSARNATEEYERLQKIFPEYRIGLLHGQLDNEKKNKVMKKFNRHQFDIMVSTTVIEVGIDVPNANIILIEGAERFGLAQLHQLRGRVGRGVEQSYCFLSTDQPNPKVLQRLNILVNSNDGFSIAEADLKLRGPGELAGWQQSGLPDFKMASLSDQELIDKSLDLVNEIIGEDPNLSNFPALQKVVKKYDTPH